MTVRDVEWKLPYTGWKAISIDENKVISLNLRDENNLIIYDEGDDEIYVDLQLPDWIRPLDAFPVGVTTGRVLVADDWDVTWTIVCFKTTSWDNIKLLYADDGKLYIDNWTWTFKQIYLKGEVDALLQALREYTDAQLALKQDKLTAWNGISIDNNNEISNTLPWPIISSSAPLDPVEWDQWYDTTNDVLKIYDGTNWNEVGSGSADVNTKTFTLSWIWSSAAVLEEAQEIYDFYLNWGNPLIKYQDNIAGFQMIYSVYDKNQWSLFFVGNLPVGNLDGSTTYVDVYQITLSLDSDTVTNVLMSPSSYTWGYLGTDIDYPTPYTPLYNWSPATKKYVDDSLAWKQDKLTAWDNITIGNVTHPNTQGPAPDWYHIPTDTEWQTLWGILTTTFSLASTWDTLKTYLKMPRAWYISTAGSINDVDTSGSYWSSTVGAGTYGRRVYCGAYNILYNGAYRSAWSSLRCFKDVSVTPDSSWTTLYDGTSIAAWAWVFHNATLWLISVSWDGTTRITIQDKNLGATQVYNSGDTLSEANSWWYFQRWNNFMFPFTWATTTSSTQVDWSGYWPWNYYSNSTFITWYDWSSVTNANLWWWTNPTWTWSKLTISATVPEESNCKVFEGYWTNYDLMPKQVYDCISNWKYAIVQVINGANNWRWSVIFSPTTITTGTISSRQYTHDNQSSNWLYYEEFNTLTITVTNWVVTSVGEAWSVVNNNWHLIVKNATAPNAIQWSAWYDTTNDVLKTYDWTTRHASVTSIDGTNYIIQTSNSAPTSWTSNNTITLVI